MPQQTSFKSKERIDFPSVVALQIDRINVILSQPDINKLQLARAVDALSIMASPFGGDVYDVSQEPDAEKMYQQAMDAYKTIMQIFKTNRFLYVETFSGSLGEDNP